MKVGREVVGGGQRRRGGGGGGELRDEENEEKERGTKGRSGCVQSIVCPVGDFLPLTLKPCEMGDNVHITLQVTGGLGPDVCFKQTSNARFLACGD